LRVGRVNHVVPADGQPADAPELIVFSEKLPLLRQDLDAMVVAVGNNQPVFGIELERVRRPELARPASGLANGSAELPVPIEDGDSSYQIGIADVRVAFRHVNISIPRVGDDVGRIGQRIGRISPHTRLAEREENLAVGAELHNDAAFVVFSGKLLEIIGARGARVGHPHISIAIHMDAVRPDEHASAKAPDLLPRFIEMVYRVRFGTEAARVGSWRLLVSGWSLLLDPHQPPVTSHQPPAVTSNSESLFDAAIRV